MKIVIRRHSHDLQVFRALAVAQAAAYASPGSTVFLECLDRFKGILELCQGIEWKNPHAPFECQPRSETKDPNGRTIPGRSGGKLYDEVIDIDADSPMELELMKSGLPWWRFIKSKVAQGSDFGAKLTISTFPELTDPPCPFPVGQIPKDYVVLCPMSGVIHPRFINANKLEAFAKANSIGKIYWIAFEDTFYGENRPVIWNSAKSKWPALAWILTNANAVFSVNGIVSAMAHSTVNGERLVKNHWHIPGRYPESAPHPEKPGVFGKDGWENDLFLSYAKRMELIGDGETSVSRIGRIQPDLSIKAV